MSSQFQELSREEDIVAPFDINSSFVKIKDKDHCFKLQSWFFLLGKDPLRYIYIFTCLLVDQNRNWRERQGCEFARIVYTTLCTS